MIDKRLSVLGALVPVLILAFLLFALLGSCVNKENYLPTANRGVLDLSTWDFPASEPVALKGEWEFYPGKLINPGPFSKPQYVEMPAAGLWSSVSVKGEPLSIYGYATWRLILSLPETHDAIALRLPEIFSSSRVFLNGKQIFSAGTPGKTAEETTPWYRTGVVRLDSVAGDNEIVVQAANFAERRGGINRNFWVGSEQSILTSYIQSLAVDLIIFGSLMTIGLYHLCLFFLRRKDHSPMWFGLCCIIIAIRSLLYGERFALDLFPTVPWEVFNRIDHLTFYIGIPAFSTYIMLIFDKKIMRIPMYIYQGLGVIFALFLFFPPSVFNVTVIGYEIITGGYIAYVLVIIIQAIIHKKEGAGTTMIGIAVFLGFGLNEILFNMGLINTFNSLSIGLSIFLFTQSVLIAIRFSKGFTQSEKLGSSLLSLNASLRRFIPQEFFVLLQKKEVDEINLGDQVEKKMSIMFSDIRSFTMLAENLGAAKTFDFLNDYYSRIGEVIRANGGFVDKYLGDGFIALFPSSPDAALQAAIGIQKVIVSFNEIRAKEDLSPIDVGIGLNYGTLILGTVGEEHRMDTTVIADSVNLCSRLEGLTKHYGKGVVVPFDFLDMLKDPDVYHWRYLGLIRVQGRRKSIETVHIYDGLSEEDFTMFDTSKDAFEDALHAYRNGEYEEAIQAFRNLAMQTPEDPAPFTFMTQIRRLMSSGLAGEWDGVDTLTK